VLGAFGACPVSAPEAHPAKRQDDEDAPINRRGRRWREKIGVDRLQLRGAGGRVIGVTYAKDPGAYDVCLRHCFADVL